LDRSSLWQFETSPYRAVSRDPPSSLAQHDAISRLLDTIALAPLQGLRRSYGSVRPSAPHRYSRLAVLAACTSPFTSERLVPAVPCNRLHPSHALSTPAATRPVIRHLAGLSQMSYTHLVSTTLDFLTTRPRKVHFRSSLGCTPARVFLALFLQRSPPTAFDRSSLEVV